MANVANILSGPGAPPQMANLEPITFVAINGTITINDSGIGRSTWMQPQPAGGSLPIGPQRWPI